MSQITSSKLLSIFTIILLCLSLVATPLQSIAYAQASEVDGVQEEQDLTEQEADVIEEEQLGEDDESDSNPDTDPGANEEQLEEANEIEEEFEQEEEEVVDYSDFEVNIDEVITTKDSITISWSVNHDIAEEYRLSFYSESVDWNSITVPADTNSYTFENLNTRENYHIEIEAKSEMIDYNYYSTNHYAYAYESITPDWSEEELVPVSLITIFNDDIWYNENIRIRGLEDNNKAYKVDEYIGNTDDLYLPLGKYEVTVYDYEDPSIAITETFDIKADVDYIKNPIQLKLRLKEAREAAEPFEFSVIKVTDNSFTLKWNEVSKITGFEIFASNWNNDDYSYHESESGLIENNISEFTLENLNSNLIYSINFISNYFNDLKYTHYFNVKTYGEDAEAPKVDFENDKLHEATASELGVYFRDLTEADMKDLTSLYTDYNDNEINSLEGIQYAHNLSSFSIYGNQISDITRLENLLKLYHLDLGSNNISDLSALANLTKLGSLYLSDNNISDISALKDLTNLYNLSLSSNKITSVEALAHLTELEQLYLDYNNISDISALKDMINLYELNLGANEITSVEALENLSELNNLFLYNNEISDISSLKNLNKLNNLELGANEISNVDALVGLSELEYLNLYNNNITDISALSKLTNLRELSLDNNDITDLPDLSDLINLEYLRLDGNDIADISVLKELPSLQYVSLYGIEITEAHMETIQYLRNDGVEVYFYYYDDGDWNDWEDEDEDEDEDYDDEIIIDREEVIKEFPEDQGFIVSEDGRSIQLDVSKDNKEKVELTPEQTRMLIANNQTLDVQKEGVRTSIPASSFDRYDDEPVTIEINEEKGDSNSLSSTYDFTIKQGTRTISQFDEGITLTFNVNADRAKNPKNLKVFYFNEETNKWENIGGTYNSNGTVTVVTAHFSKFTVFEAEEEESDVIVELPEDEGTEESNDTDEPSEDEGTEESNDADESSKDEGTEESNDTDESSGSENAEESKSTHEEIQNNFPEDQGFQLSEDGKQLIYHLTAKQGKLELAAEQVNMLIEKKLALNIVHSGGKLSIPASIFNKDESVTINISEIESEPNSFSKTYDFTIEQGTETISQFDEGITLTFNVNVEGANDPKNLKVFYFNEKTKEWEKIGGTYHTDDTVTVLTTHFSKFTVFEIVEETPKDSDGTNELPSTATNLYNLLAVGLLLILTGFAVYFVNRRKAQVK